MSSVYTNGRQPRAVCDNDGSEKVESGPSSRLDRQAFHKNATVRYGRTSVVRGAMTERPLLGLYYALQSWKGMTGNVALPPLSPDGRR
jgi:hypothetical protein